MTTEKLAEYIMSALVEFLGDDCAKPIVLKRLREKVLELSQEFECELNEEAEEAPEFSASPRRDGWDVYHWGKAGHLKKSDGWTQTLVDQAMRLFNEGLPL